MKHPKLTLIRGLPGSGKSTMAKQMMQTSTASIQHFETDQYFIDPAGRYTFNGAMLQQAHSWCMASVESVLKQGIDVIVSNTFTTMREIRPYIDISDRVGCDVEIIEATGNFESVHGVPEDTMQRMRHRFQSTETILREI